MKIILCPNCGQAARPQGRSVICPKCGMVPLLEDSQIISISGGKIGGPGLANLQDTQQHEMVIHSGVAQEIPKDKMTIKVSPHVPEGTVETEAEFDWKKPVSSKPVPVAKTRMAAEPAKERLPKAGTVAKIPRRPESAEKRKKPQQVENRRGKEYPIYYKYVFYGVPGFLLVALVMITVWRVIHAEDLTQKWEQARKIYDSGEACYQNAQMLKGKNQKQYVQNLKNATALYREAIENGEKVLNSQIALEMKKGMDRAQAEKYVQQEYGKYYATIATWRGKLEKVDKMLAESQ